MDNEEAKYSVRPLTEEEGKKEVEAFNVYLEGKGLIMNIAKGISQDGRIEVYPQLLKKVPLDPKAEGFTPAGDGETEGKG